MTNAQLLRTLETLAAAARPTSDDDWGSERQIKAENWFFEFFLAQGLSSREFDRWCLKATAEEMLDEAMARAHRALDVPRVLLQEFPDFDPASLPPIPEGFMCTAWHNDSVPTWHRGESISEPKGGDLMIGIDFADPAQREFPDTQRFTLHIYWGDSSPEPLISSDDWADIQAAVRLADAIADLRLGFHPDTRPADYEPPLDPDQREHLAADMETVAAVMDLYEFGLEVWAARGLITREEARR